MKTEVRDYVGTIKTGFQALAQDEIELRIGTIRPWLGRVEDTRLRYDAGTITPDEKAQLPPGSQRRAAGYHLTPMTEREHAAAWDLYRQFVALLASLTHDAYRSVCERVPGVNLSISDALSESWELFLMTLSAFNPDRGSLSTWLSVDYPSKIAHVIARSASEEEELPELFEAESGDLSDVEEYLDFRQWGEDFTRHDPKLRAIWRAIIGQSDADL